MILTIINLILWIIVSIFILLSPVVTKIEYTLCVITLIIELISNIVFRVQINEYKDKYNKLVYGECISSICEVEVIGNVWENGDLLKAIINEIHDNPELLKEVK